MSDKIKLKNSIDLDSIYQNFKAKKIIKIKNNDEVYSLVHFRENLEKNTKALIITSGYANFWFHTDITDKFFNDYNFNIYIIDTPEMGTAITDNNSNNNSIVSIENRIKYLDICFDELDIFNSNKNVYWLSHSTSGLFAIRYYKLGKYKNQISKYIMNAPLFELNKSALLNKIMIPIYSFLGKFDLFKNINGQLGVNKKESVTIKYYYKNVPNLITSFSNYENLQPKLNQEVDLGFFYTVTQNTKLLKDGYIEENDKDKFVVLLSDNFDPKENSNDNTLDVIRIKEICQNMGIETIVIENANHDVFSSIEKVRNNSINILKKILI